jgi:hypothetical protein
MIKNPNIAKDLEHLISQHEKDESMLERFKRGHKKTRSLKRQHVTYAADPKDGKMIPIMKIHTGQDDSQS